MSLNDFKGIGRLTKNPELRMTNNQKYVASFTIAIDRGFETVDGQSADFINCVCWGKVAENVDKYLNKGSLVCVDGKLRSRTYKDNKDVTHYITEVVCVSVQFLERKQEENRQQGQASNNQNTSYDGWGYMQPDDMQF